jgi:YbbR domain-containing protein
MFTKNIGLKAFSVLLAIVLSYVVNSGQNSSVVSLVVPVEIQNAPERRVLVRPVKRSVQVTIQGPSFLVGTVASSPPPMRIKLPNQDADRFPVSFKASDISLPTGVRVIGLDPAELDLIFEPIERREVRVEVPRLGALPKHLTLDRVDINPVKVFVSGPSSEVRQIKTVESEPIDLRELKDSVVTDLTLRVPGTQSTLSVSRVSAVVKLGAVPRERMLEGLSVEVRAAAEFPALSIEPAAVTVTVAGPGDEVSELDRKTVIPYVRLPSSPGSGSVSVDVQVELPPGMKLIRVEPRAVQVRKDGGNRLPSRSKSAKAR